MSFEVKRAVPSIGSHSTRSDQSTTIHVVVGCGLSLKHPTVDRAGCLKAHHDVGRFRPTEPSSSTIRELDIHGYTILNIYIYIYPPCHHDIITTWKSRSTGTAPPHHRDGRGTMRGDRLSSVAWAAWRLSASARSQDTSKVEVLTTEARIWVSRVSVQRDSGGGCPPGSKTNRTNHEERS